MGKEPIHHSILAHSQTWFGFFNGRYRSPAALPISAPFFFESKAARLTFVRHCWSQSFCWWLFQPREDAAADYPCSTIAKKIQSCICCIVVFSVA